MAAAHNQHHQFWLFCSGKEPFHTLLPLPCCWVPCPPPRSHTSPPSTWRIHTQLSGFNIKITSSTKPSLILPSVSPQCPPEPWITN